MTVTESDFREIEQLLYRYAWMVDKREWHLMDQVFAPDGTIDYQSTGGPGKMPYRAALKWLNDALAGFPINLHHITNISVETSGNTGKARCYFTAPMGKEMPDGSKFFITNAGFYLDDLVRVEGEWRIASRWCDMTVQIGQLPEGHVIPDPD